ncbi:uncharacterized protein KY384_002648 [Bacidia gigantensis]|uniref:uncharacterized protein n=1 Tax=Bacidia gigantensis TaxID=2732470 RepID=UPI001D05B2CD|nr:uncharacterized protein KY384_002648 [Bacidia gigantensis]KAG8532770.1 hypothetical protein KY384_002648 [Bacidia gigantensis]
MASQLTINKVQEYASHLAKEDVENRLAGDELDDYASRLNRSLNSLQYQVKQHESILEKVIITNAAVGQLREQISVPSIEESSENFKAHLQQVQKATASYKSLIASEPTLPSPESPLPALLAIRRTLNLIEQTKRTIKDMQEKLLSAQAELRNEDQTFRDAQYLRQALEDRVAKLRTEETAQGSQSVNEIAAGLVLEQQLRRRRYAKELRNLVRAFNIFVAEDLSVMLAAEDLGGPVVGDALDLNEEALKSGFTQQGKPKKTSADDDKAEMRRLERNEQIWGTGSQSEAEAAEREFRDLVENLLNAAAQAEASSPYIVLKKENAAVRYLVRVKVAQFHPEDAKKLRLLEFGAD